MRKKAEAAAQTQIFEHWCLAVRLILCHLDGEPVTEAELRIGWYAGYTAFGFAELMSSPFKEGVLRFEQAAFGQSAVP